jgi:hypothetical protein
MWLLSGQAIREAQEWRTGRGSRAGRCVQPGRGHAVCASRCAWAGWNRRMMMGTMDKLLFPPILARCGRWSASLSRVCSLMLGICSPRTARDPGGPMATGVLGPASGLRENKQDEFSNRSSATAPPSRCRHMRRHSCAAVSNTCENPAAGHRAVWWRARRGSERRSVKTWEPSVVAGSGLALAGQEWFEEAYQGRTIAEVWGLVDWGARPGTETAKRWPVHGWRASVPQRAGLPCWAG